jgi:phage terminase large subunit-like protein
MDPAWNTACLDWESRLMAGRSLIPDLPLFADEAARALRIFKRLRLPDVIGTPTMAEACGEWFFPIVETIFGSYDPETNCRMIQEFFELIPKKNSKSSNGGAVMVTAMIVNRRPEAEFLLIAPTMEIAGIAFKQASGTIRLDTELDKLFQIQRHLKLITHRKTGATLQIKAADTDVITGSKATGTMIDETHVFAKRANAADVFVEIRGALTARPDGFLFQTTTQSKEPPTGVFKSELAMARDVRDGKIRLPLLPVLYELPPGMANNDGWKAPHIWPLVNPNMGRSVNPDFLEREIRKAEREGVGQLALIASQHFNVEVGIGLRTDRWIGAEHWLAAAEPGLTLDAILARCEVCTIGIDGGGLDDLLGLAVIGRERDTRRWLHWGHAWLHSGGLERRKSEASKYMDLVKAGDLTIFEDLGGGEGEVGDDVSQVVDVIERVRAARLLPAENGIGVDPVGISAVIDELERREISTKDSKLIASVTQGWKLTNSIKDAERRIAAKTLRHCGQDIMTWAAGNAKVEARGNAITITKQAAGTAKIDPLMALFNAVALMAMNPQPARKVTAKSLLVV